MSNKQTYDNSFKGLFVEYLKLQNEVGPMKSKHYHDYFEIYYYLGANMEYFVGDKNYALKKNNLLLIDKCVFHKTSYEPGSENERVLIGFSDEVLRLFADNTLKEKILALFQSNSKLDFNSPGHLETIHNLIFNIVSNYYSPSAYNMETSRLNLAELLLRLVEYADKNMAANIREINQHRKSENSVVEIIKYINENYNAKITLDSLVDKFFVNKYYLCHIFKHETGLSIIDFVNNKRLSEAEIMLKTTDLSVTDICYKVGFNSINHFLKLFKNSYELTPKKFRERIRMKTSESGKGAS